jgi:hypothetical protein
MMQVQFFFAGNPVSKSIDPLEASSLRNDHFRDGRSTTEAPRRNGAHQSRTREREVQPFIVSSHIFCHDAEIAITSIVVHEQNPRIRSLWQFSEKNNIREADGRH